MITQKIANFARLSTVAVVAVILFVNYGTTQLALASPTRALADYFSVIDSVALKPTAA